MAYGKTGPGTQSPTFVSGALGMSGHGAVPCRPHRPAFSQASSLDSVPHGTGVNHASTARIPAQQHSGTQSPTFVNGSLGAGVKCVPKCRPHKPVTDQSPTFVDRDVETKRCKQVAVTPVSTKKLTPIQPAKPVPVDFKPEYIVKGDGTTAFVSTEIDVPGQKAVYTVSAALTGTYHEVTPEEIDEYIGWDCGIGMGG